MCKDEECPLAFAQRQLWFLEQLTPGGSAYNLLDGYHIHGRIQGGILEHSLGVLVQRHGALRSSFREVAGQPLQVIAETADVHLARFDLRSLPGVDKEREARRIAEAEVNRPFSLTQLPLWRVSLIEFGEQDCWLLLTIHHIIFDGWSSEVFWRELMELCDGASRTGSFALPEDPMQMADFVRWEHQHLGSEAGGELLQYWREKLSGQISRLELPTDFPRPPKPTYRGSSYSILLPKALEERLRDLSRQENGTLFITLLTAFKVLLFRYTSQEDVVLGTPFACRSQAGQAGIIGFLVNTLVIRSVLDGKQSFLDLMMQVRGTALKAYDHGEIPFSLLVETLRPERDLSFNPLFQTMFQMEQQLPVSPEGSLLRFTPLTLDFCDSIFDLTLNVRETPAGLLATLEYSSDLFLPETIERMLSNFEVLLEGVVADPRKAIGELPLLTKAERSLLLEDWNSCQGSESINEVGLVAKDSSGLTLTIKRSAGELIGEIVHQGDLSDAGAIALVLEQFISQLRRVSSESDYSPPDHLDLENGSVSHLRMTWGHHANSLNQGAPVKCLHRYFEDRARQTPDRVAICHQDQSLTYAELNSAANQLAHRLIECGVKADMPVGLCLERSLDMVIALLAILKSGGAYLPLDPGYPAERISFMVEDAQVQVALTQSSLMARLTSSIKHVLCLDRDGRLLESKSKANPVVLVGESDLAYIIYTSGSTGKAKGVMIEHRAASRFVQAAIAHYEIDSLDCMLQFGSISFDLAVEEIFTCLSAGARLQLRNEDMLSSPSRFLQLCQSWGVTILDLPTAYWHQMAADAAYTRGVMPPSLRLVIIGGERVSPSLVKDWLQIVGDYPRLFNSYGPTEATVVATGFWITRAARVRQEVPIGRPLANSEVYVLDSYGQPVPIGAPGELYIGGRSLARGYLNRSDLTQLKFIPHLFEPGANRKLYRTGDQVRYLSDGNLEFLGRMDNQVKIRGFRIELGEVEAALLQYSGVREAVVVPVADNSGSQRLIAYIVGRGGESVSEEDMRSFLRKKLPAYMVPGVIILLEALPLTPNGKVDFVALPIPSQVIAEKSIVATTFIGPRTPLEHTLVGIWCDILNLPKVSVRDGFFHLGGHSLQALQVIARIRSELEVELPLSALFQSSSVAEMAELLAQTGVQGRWSPLVPLQAGGSKRPFYAIHGGHGEVLFYKALGEHLGNDQPFYALRARGNDYPDMPHRRVEEMASCYIEAIRKVQPEGPYRLGGASFGGIVAYEMAQQLHAQGQGIESLVLFDTGGFDTFTKRLPLRRRIVNVLRYVPKYGLAETWKRLQLRVLKLFAIDSAVEFYRATGMLPDASSPAMAIWETVWKANLAATECYVPKAYPGSVILLRATDDGDFMWNDIDANYGWGAYALGGVERYDLPGTHIGMFQEPHVQRLAQTLDVILSRSQ